jgi:hypothetical protein
MQCLKYRWTKLEDECFDPKYSKQLIKTWIWKYFSNELEPFLGASGNGKIVEIGFDKLTYDRNTSRKLELRVKICELLLTFYNDHLLHLTVKHSVIMFAVLI